MASQFTIPQIINFAKISQYLASNEKAILDQLKSGSLIGNLSGLLYMEGTLLQNMYALNPSGPTIRGTAEWVLSLCGKYAIQAQNIINNLAASPPIITGPANQSVNVGSTATFTVSVVSATNYTLQWYLNGVAIPGAIGLSYNVINAQLSQSGGLYSAVATNGAGSVSSVQGLLTVNAALTGYFTYSTTTDFYPVLLTSSDPFVYGTSYSITHNAPIVITLPGAMPSNVYILAKVPAGESIKTIWNNTAFNYGTIPDAVFESMITFGGWDYYASRGQCTMDVTSTLTLS